MSVVSNSSQAPCLAEIDKRGGFTDSGGTEHG